MAPSGGALRARRPVRCRRHVDPCARRWPGIACSTPATRWAYCGWPGPQPKGRPSWTRRRARGPRRRSPRPEHGPVFTLPACMHTMAGPSRRAGPRDACARGRRRAPGSRCAGPAPAGPALITEGWASSPATTVTAGAPCRPSASTSQPARSSTAWRAAARPGKLAMVAPVTKRRPIRRAAAERPAASPGRSPPGRSPRAGAARAVF